MVPTMLITDSSSETVSKLPVNWLWCPFMAIEPQDNQNLVPVGSPLSIGITLRFYKKVIRCFPRRLHFCRLHLKNWMILYSAQVRKHKPLQVLHKEAVQPGFGFIGNGNAEEIKRSQWCDLGMWASGEPLPFWTWQSKESAQKPEMSASGFVLQDWEPCGRCHLHQRARGETSCHLSSTFRDGTWPKSTDLGAYKMQPVGNWLSFSVQAELNGNGRSEHKQIIS